MPSSDPAASPGPQEGPLTGLRVIELASMGPVAYAGLLLSELGAEVVRIDRPGCVGIPGAPTPTLDRSRPTLTLDLKQPAGRDALLRVVDRADVIVEGMRPGVAERLGIGPDDCCTRNARLVYGRMTGWGQDGPLATAVGHDINFAGLTGALHATGGADRPRQCLNLVGDFGGGTMFLMTGILTALYERERSGRGQVIDAAMVDGAASLMTMVFGLHADRRWQDRREANLLDGGAPFYDTYRCADGRFVAVGALEPAFFAAPVDGLGLAPESEQYDVAGWPELRARLTEAFARRTRDAWTDHFAGTDACVTPVLSLAEAPHHPHYAARGTFVPVPGGFEPVVAPRFSRTPGRAPGPPDATGADTWWS